MFIFEVRESSENTLAGYVVAKNAYVARMYARAHFEPFADVELQVGILVNAEVLVERIFRTDFVGWAHSDPRFDVLSDWPSVVKLLRDQERLDVAEEVLAKTAWTRTQARSQARSRKKRASTSGPSAR